MSIPPEERPCEYSTSYSATVHETPFFLMSGCQVRLPVDIVIGLSHLGPNMNSHESTAEMQANLQLVFEIARGNLAE